MFCLYTINRGLPYISCNVFNSMLLLRLSFNKSQIWGFLIPNCYGEQRTKYNRFLYLSGSRFSLFLFLTLPNVWPFPYFMGATSTNLLILKLRPKIYDHIMLTVRISFILLVCSQVPVTVICFPELRNLHEQSSFFYGFFAFHSSSFHTSGYLVPNCHSFPYFFDN